MKIHEFSIIASGLDPEAPDFEDRFFKAGCDDATISFQKGHVIVDFAREAETVDEAVASAVAAVEAAGAKVDRVEPDPLVSLSEIAARTGMSRAAMTQYSKGQRGKAFPAPVARVTSDSPLWDWVMVSEWLLKQEKVSPEVVATARVVKAANEVIGAGERPTKERIKKRVDGYAAA